MEKHYNRIGQERLLNKLYFKVEGKFCNNISSKLSDYQLMSMLNVYLKKLDLVQYTHEELEMDLN